MLVECAGHVQSDRSATSKLSKSAAQRISSQRSLLNKASEFTSLARRADSAAPRCNRWPVSRSMIHNDCSRADRIFWMSSNKSNVSTPSARAASTQTNLQTKLIEFSLSVPANRLHHMAVPTVRCSSTAISSRSLPILSAKSWLSIFSAVLTLNSRLSKVSTGYYPAVVKTREDIKSKLSFDSNLFLMVFPNKTIFMAGRTSWFLNCKLSLWVWWPDLLDRKLWVVCFGPVSFRPFGR